jgi:hypothetical protein
MNNNRKYTIYNGELALVKDLNDDKVTLRYVKEGKFTTEVLDKNSFENISEIFSEEKEF